MSFDVAIAACPDYSPDSCRRALLAVMEPLGGLDWVTPGMRVAIKANLVTAMKPETAVLTHPALLRELTVLLAERGAQVVIGDSPGGLYNGIYLDRVYAAAGLKQAEQAGAVLNHDFSQREVQFPAGKVCRSFPYTAYLDSADAIIDFCKLKTHGMMGLSAAAKNLFGVIPGTVKPEFHFKYPNAADFARMIVDLDEFVRPRFSLCDAVVAMEGNGPTAGTPRQMGALLASASPHKLDLLAAALVGLGKQDVPTLQAAFERGLIPAEVQALAVSGPWQDFRVSDFKTIEVHSDLLFRGGSGGRIHKLRGALIAKALRAKPVVTKPDCIGCCKCFEICPAKAITMQNKLPVIDRKVCIRCFCCQEFCPKGAMRVHRPAIARLLNR